MDDERRPCWWCREPHTPEGLFHLEGARLAGSPKLPLPLRLSERERLELAVCMDCARSFGYARLRHDAELEEAGIRPGGTSGKPATVSSYVRKVIGAEGDQDAHR